MFLRIGGRISGSFLACLPWLPPGWEKDENGQWHQVEKEISNRRVATDFTFSLRKEQSVYLASSEDKLYESFCIQARNEQLAEIEASAHTRVRKGNVYETRQTGEVLWAIFEDKTTRPIDGVPEMHWHWHCLAANVTYDPVENERKAVDFSEAFKNKAYHEAKFQARIDELAMQAGYGYRQTKNGLELSILRPGESRIFCKRTREIEKLEKEDARRPDETGAGDSGYCRERGHGQRRGIRIREAEGRAGGEMPIR
jgi:conjugative relaxase-like TrwC/TraI family protein